MRDRDISPLEEFEIASRHDLSHSYAQSLVESAVYNNAFGEADIICRLVIFHNGNQLLAQIYNEDPKYWEETYETLLTKQGNLSST
jgi:hypothetical protein